VHRLSGTLNAHMGFVFHLSTMFGRYGIHTSAISRSDFSLSALGGGEGKFRKESKSRQRCVHAPVYGREFEGASRTILHDCQCRRPGARRRRLMRVAVLRIALRAGSPAARHRAVAASANFADSYQIDPDLSIIKYQYRNHA
jgi:hypothetical protein